MGTVLPLILKFLILPLYRVPWYSTRTTGTTGMKFGAPGFLDTRTVHVHVGIPTPYGKYFYAT